MRKKVKKLTLNRETVHTLDLMQAVGGEPGGSVRSFYDGTCYRCVPVEPPPTA